MDRKSQLARLGLFDTRVPRYTSYPTAPQFGAEVGPRQAAEWLAAVPPGARLSLYVHIPFCRRLCWFCACRTQGTRSMEPVAAYLRLLEGELALLAAHLPQGVELARMHWGGGTPTLLEAGMIAQLSGAIRAVLPLAPDAEFLVEIDPSDCGPQRLRALAAAGMTRALIGVQDFDPQIQQTIGRKQSFDCTRTAVDGLREAGIRSLSAAILFGLPRQTPARITASMQKLLSLTPDRVAVQGYVHVPAIARRQSMIATDTLPRPDARLDLFETARRLLLWDGYGEIGIDHFVRPGDSLARASAEGRLRRGFHGYTDDPGEVLIGIGASAISRFPQGYTQNAAATSAYASTIAAGQLATARGHAFRGEDRLRGALIEALMCDFRIDRAAILSRFPEAAAQLEQLLAELGTAFPGLLTRSAGGLAIKPQARALTRRIAGCLDAYAMKAQRGSTTA